jgi:hypothetical protein
MNSKQATAPEVTRKVANDIPGCMYDTSGAARSSISLADLELLN